MTNCLDCQRLTNRHNNLCPNCYYSKPESDNPQSVLEDVVLNTYKFTCACGQDNTRALILMCKGGPGLMPGAPKSLRPKPRNDRALMVTNPDFWYAQCHNCYHKSNARSPGRPKKYTDEERKWMRNQYPKVYKANLNTRVVQSYGSRGEWPECITCLQPATRVLYIGEFGKAPIGNHAIRCKRLAITDPTWHMQYAPYCDNHEVMNIGQRAKQKKQIQAQELLETLWKSSRTLAELEH